MKTLKNHRNAYNSNSVMFNECTAVFDHMHIPGTEGLIVAVYIILHYSVNNTMKYNISYAHSGYRWVGYRSFCMHCLMLYYVVLNRL